MDKQITALTIQTEDYKEHDKKALLFSAEEGMVTAVLKGVKKANAKLKFATQPFCICSYELVERNGYYTVTGATCIEDMFALVRNTDKYICASAVMETVKTTSGAVSTAELFVVMLKTLKAMAYTHINPYVALAKYLQKVLSMTGFVKRDPPFTGHVQTPSQFLGAISSRYLDELEYMTTPDDIVKSASIIEIKKIEKLFDVKYNSLKFIDVSEPIIEEEKDTGYDEESGYESQIEYDE